MSNFHNSLFSLSPEVLQCTDVCLEKSCTRFSGVSVYDLIGVYRLAIGLFDCMVASLDPLAGSSAIWTTWVFCHFQTH